MTISEGTLKLECRNSQQVMLRWRWQPVHSRTWEQQF